MSDTPTFSDGRNGNRAYIAPSLGNKPRLSQVDEAECIFCPQNWGKLKPYGGVDTTEMAKRGMLAYYNPHPQVDLHLTVVGTRNHNLNEFAPTQEALDYWVNFFWASAGVSDVLAADGHNFCGVGKNRNGRILEEGKFRDVKAGGSQPHDHLHVVGTYETPFGLEDRLFPRGYLKENLVQEFSYKRLNGCIRCEDLSDYVSGEQKRLFNDKQLDRFVVYVERHPELYPYIHEVKIVPLEHTPHLSKLSSSDLISLGRVTHETMFILNEEYQGMGYNILIREGPRKGNKGDPRTYHLEVRIFAAHPKLRNERDVGILPALVKGAILPEDPKITTEKLQRHVGKFKI